MWKFQNLSKKVSRIVASLVLVTAQMTPFFVFTTPALAAGITISDHEGQLSPSDTWSNGNIKTYSELDSINFRFDVDSSGASEGTIDIEFAEEDNMCLFFDGTFVLGTHDNSFSTVENTSGTNPVVSKVGNPIVSGDDWVQTINFKFSAAGDATVYYYLTLSDEAGLCSGSSTHTQFGDNSGDVPTTGAQTVSIPANDILQNPSLTITKTVSSGNALPSDFSFTVSHADSGVRTVDIPIGQNSVTITELNPDGVFTITENGPADYTFSGGTGTSCTADLQTIGTVSGVMVATATSDTSSPVDAICNFTNDDDAPTLTLYKEVIDNNSGDSEPSDWMLTATPSSGATLTGSGEDGFENKAVTAGIEYTLSESGPDGYFVDMDWRCEGGLLVDGNKITLDLGTDAVCWIVNNDIANPDIQIVKSGPLTADEGDTVTYTAAITNTGDTPLLITSIFDDVVGEVDLIYEGDHVKGDSNKNDILDIGETWFGEVEYLVPSEQDEDIVNTMKVCAADITEMNLGILPINAQEDGELSGDVCAEDTHTTDIIRPSINIVKSGPSSAVAGSEVTYTFTVTNDGDVALKNIVVNDSITGPATYVSGDIDADTYLDLDETWIFEAVYTIPVTQSAPVNNTATACGYEHLDMSIEFDTISYLLGYSESEEEITSIEICDEDSHTLTIPQVLGASVFVTTTAPQVLGASNITTASTPEVLANTGSTYLYQLFVGLMLIGFVRYIQQKEFTVS